MGKLKKVRELVPHPRKGINADQRAGQYVCKVGFHLSAKGERVRQTQYLTANADEATLRHIRLQQQWGALESNWSILADMIRPGLPEHLRNADFSKPVWLKEEWGDAALAVQRGTKDAMVEKLLETVVQKTATNLQQIDEAKDFLGRLKPDTTAPSQLTMPPDLALSGLSHQVLTGNLLNILPPDLRARVLQALQPAANEVSGLAVDARLLTIRQAAEEFLSQEKARVGNKLRGIGANTYMHTKRMVDDALRLLDENADLRVLNHQRLSQFVIDAGSKAKSQRTAYNWVRAGLKPVLEWAHKRSDVNYRMPDSIEDLFRLRKPHTDNKMTYSPETAEILKAIRTASEKMRADSWVFVLLALNTGAYAADIASWTYENLKIAKDGKVYLEWTRVKEKHHSPAMNRHQLWPETWERMQMCLAPDDPERNPERRLFLSRDGRPMWMAELDKPRVDAIGHRYKRAVDVAYLEHEDGKHVPVALAFKQLRKIGMNAMNEFSGGSLEVVRIYAGHVIPGVSAAYLVNRYEDVTKVLGKWREQLLADGVLNPIKPVKAKPKKLKHPRK